MLAVEYKSIVARSATALLDCTAAGPIWSCREVGWERLASRLLLMMIASSGGEIKVVRGRRNVEGVPSVDAA
jgi:hypothetical protein